MARTSYIRGLLSSVPTTVESALERVAAMDQPETVQPILSADELQKRIRMMNNRLLEIEIEYEKTRSQMIVLQRQLINQTKDHAQGWRISAELISPSVGEDAETDEGE